MDRGFQNESLRTTKSESPTTGADWRRILEGSFCRFSPAHRTAPYRTRLRRTSVRLRA